MTKVSLCLSSIVYYFSKKSIFHAILIVKNCFVLAVFICSSPIMTFAYRGFQRLFFTFLELNSSRQNRDSEAQSGAFSNREHGLFHLKYFDNGPLERG